MLIDKKELPLVDMDFMNEVHEEDIEIINTIFQLILDYEATATQSKADEIAREYQKWVQHTIEHFQGEEVKMEALNFPPYQFHKAEHDNALARMNAIFKAWENAKDIKILKTYFIEELPNWLIAHIQSMDAVTASFFKTGQSPCSIGGC